MKKISKSTVVFLIFVYCFGVSTLKASAFYDVSPDTLIDPNEYIQKLRDLYNLDEIIEGTFELSIRPSKPVAEEKITARMWTNRDSNTSMISWFLNGEFQTEGYGLNTFEFNVGEIGEVTTLEVNIVTNLGVERREKIEIIPAEVDILWQTNTHTPTPYKGKNLSPSTNRGFIQFIALPKFTNNEKVEDPDDFVFHWSLNDNKRTDLSGRGRNIMEIDLSNLSRRTSVAVTVEHMNKDQNAIKKISIPTISNPEVLVYKRDKYGIDYSVALNHLTNYQPTERKFDLVSKPFYFTKKPENELDITWFMNKRPLPDYKNSLLSSFVVERNFTGKTLVSVEVKNPSNFREKSSSDVSVLVENNTF